MSGSCWTPQAVDAAYLAFKDGFYSLARPCSVIEAERTGIKAALAVAERHAREALAREVEAIDRIEGLWAPTFIAERLRAGVPAPEPCAGCDGHKRVCLECGEPTCDTAIPCPDCQGPS